MCLWFKPASAKAITEAKLKRYEERAAAYEKAGNYKRAFRLHKKIENKSVSPLSKANAILAQGRCMEKRFNNWKAYLQYQRAVDEYASYIPYIEVLKLEYDIANEYFSGKKDKFLFFSFSNYSKAIEIYDHIAMAAPYGPFTADAIYRSGLLSMKIKNNEDAAEKFRTIITRYTSSAKVNDAKIQLADALLRSAAQTDADGTLVEQALRVLRTVNENALSPSRADETKDLLQTARSMQATRLFYLAEFYQRDAHRRDYASKRYLDQIINSFGDTKSADKAKKIRSIIASEPVAAGDGSEEN